MTNRSGSKKRRSRLRPTKGAREAAKRLAVEETAAAEAAAGSEDAAVEEGCTHVGDAPSVSLTTRSIVACKSDEVPCPCTVL